MPYSEKEYQASNVNYLNKDFLSLKSSLVEYAKTYFPNSYRDFNETSPGMMLIEMSAYVGDVLSFYIDNQYKEMMLPLAEERRNLVNIASMLGYKVKPTSPAYVDITIKQTVSANDTDINNILPNTKTDGQVIDEGLKITSATDSSITFETLGVVDFIVSSSYDSLPTVSATTAEGMASEFQLTRKIRAISGERKTKSFIINSPEKFKRLTLPETNVVDIIDVRDSNGNKWYEVEYLAEDKISIEKHYLEDNRDMVNVEASLTQSSAYGTIDDDTAGAMLIPVPYTLNYRKVTKRFITELNEDNTTSLVFGNGILHSASTGSLSNGFIQTQQVGIIIPGETENISSDISPVLSTVGSSLGEAPSNTNLTVTYRIGGGFSSNVNANDLTLLNNGVVRLVNGNSVTPTVTNIEPARGGGDGDSIEEIRRKTQANFITQKRCVTKEDYEARVITMPAKFGNIAKVSVNRNFGTYGTDVQTSADGSGGINYTKLFNIMNTLITNYNDNGQTLSFTDGEIATLTDNLDIRDDGVIDGSDAAAITDIGSTVGAFVNGGIIPSIEVHILSYDNNKNLVDSPTLLQQNLRNYLNQFRIITDEFAIYNGKVVNFGVVFEVAAHRHANKQDVKLRCINTIIEYFNIDKLQFRQSIYTNDLIYELMGLDGVRGVNYLELTQGLLSDGAPGFDPKLYDSSISDGNVLTGNNSGYGYEYNFSQFYGDGKDGVILPSVEPSVFELKNPNENIKGSVI